ncbi:hypothetical protein GN956_G11153 [Arapaima gigas]
MDKRSVSGGRERGGRVEPPGRRDTSGSVPPRQGGVSPRAERERASAPAPQQSAAQTPLGPVTKAWQSLI